MSELNVTKFEKASSILKSEADDYKYTAFISYRHLKPDAQIAKSIHTMIETFKAPKEFYIDGKPPKFRVFRDREELTTSSLADSLDEALRSSKFLIVICSKRLPLSEWCNKEVKQFISMNGVDRVIPVLIEGEPQDSFPHALKDYKIETVSETGETIVETKEILAAELRPAEVLDPDFMGYEALEKSNPTKLEQLTKDATALLKTEKYRIMAAILGVSYGDLKQRDKERRQKQLLISSAIACALLLFFGIFMFNAYQNENRAKIQTIQDKSKMMMNNAEDLIRQGDKIKAILVANQAMANLDPNMAQYQQIKNQHYAILNNTVDNKTAAVTSVINTNNQFTFLTFFHQKDYFVAGLNNDAVGIWDIKTGTLIHELKGHTQQVKLVEVAKDDSLFLSGGFDDLIILWDGQSFEKIGEIKAPGNVMLLDLANDSKSIHVIVDQLDKYVYQRYDLETLKVIGPEIEIKSSIRRIRFNHDDTKMLVNFNTRKQDHSLVIYDLEEGIIEQNFADQNFESSILEGENKSYKLAYDDVEVNDDFTSLYAVTSGEFVKLDVKTGKTLFRIDNTLYDKFPFVLTKDEKYFYLGESTTLSKYDANTGKLLAEIKINGDSIAQVVMSKDNQTLITMSKDGTINLIRNDLLVQPNIDYKQGRPEYIYLTPDNEYLLTLSLNDRNIKIISLNPKNAAQIIDGQISGKSENHEYGLFYNNGVYTLFDNKTMKPIREVKSEYLNSDYVTLPNGRGFSVSDDGSLLFGPYVPSMDEAGSIVVIDSMTGDLKFKKEIEMLNFFLGMSHDNQFLFANSGPSEISLYYLNEDKIDTLFFDPGYVSNINFSPDNQYYSVSYIEGISNIYKTADQKLVTTIPGKILYFKSEGNESEIVSIYNNVGAKYKNFEKVSEVILTKQRDEYGQGFNDLNDYSPEKDLLLTIRKADKKTWVYLVDFKSGQLIKTYDIPIEFYNVNAYFTPTGNGIIVDYHYGSTQYGFSDEITNYRKNNAFVIKSALFTLQDYDDIYKDSLELTKDVQLTDEEKEELGLK